MEGEALLTQLDEAQKALVVALEEACAADLARLDTPELIRIEETLNVASKAAKEAVSMRLRLDSHPGNATSQRAASVGTDASAPIPHRVFEDSRGRRWHAFAVLSSNNAGSRAALPAAFRNGWLVFDSADEVRRIAPIPREWVDLPIDKLRLLCEKTAGMRKRSSQSEEPRPRPPIKQ